MPPLVLTGLSILVLTLFLDVLELSFARIIWFMKTLRFWLYYVLHFGISCLAAYLLHFKVGEWYWLALGGAVLGVGVISNSNVKLAGYSIVPLAEIFQTIRTKMFEQAAEDKVAELKKAQLAERLQKLSVQQLEQAARAALTAAGKDEDKISGILQRKQHAAQGNDDRYKTALIAVLLKTNFPYAEQNIASWEKPPPPQTP